MARHNRWLRLANRDWFEFVCQHPMYDSITIEEGFPQKPLSAIQLKAVCGPDSSLASADRVPFSAPANHPLIDFLDDTVLFGEVIKRMENEGGRELNVAVRTRSLLAAIGLILEGPYIMFLAEPVLDRFSKLGLRAIKFEKDMHSFETGMYYRESHRQTEPFRHFLSSIQRLARQDRLVASKQTFHM